MVKKYRLKVVRYADGLVKCTLQFKRLGFWWKRKNLEGYSGFPTYDEDRAMERMYKLIAREKVGKEYRYPEPEVVQDVE